MVIACVCLSVYSSICRSAFLSVCLSFRTSSLSARFFKLGWNTGKYLAQVWWWVLQPIWYRPNSINFCYVLFCLHSNSQHPRWLYHKCNLSKSWTGETLIIGFSYWLPARWIRAFSNKDVYFHDNNVSNDKECIKFIVRKPKSFVGLTITGTIWSSIASCDTIHT